MAHFWQRRICWLHDLRRDDEPGATSLPASTTNATFPSHDAFTTSRAAATAAPAAATTSLALAATADHIATLATLAAAAAALATQFATPARSSTKLAHTDGWQHVRDHQ